MIALLCLKVRQGKEEPDSEQQVIIIVATMILLLWFHGCDCFFKLFQFVRL